jgi:hypothetical protein
MPNWTFNTLSVSGEKEILADFVSKTIISSTDEDYDTNGKFTFSILHPLPDDLKGDSSPLPRIGNETDEQFKQRMDKNILMYGAKDWYDWHNNNWGTKWDACHSQIQEVEDEYLNVRFDTAWSPPFEWFEKVIPMYPQLDFDLLFDIEGDSDCGRLIGRNGEIELEMTKLDYTDDDGRKVDYDLKLHKWKYADNGEVIEDEDFYPMDINPYA